MNILPKSYHRLSKNLGAWVSNYYQPSQFGIRGRFVEGYRIGQYVEMDAPGTGFFARNSSSHTYRTFVRMQVKKRKSNYWKLLTGRQFSFDKEMKRATEVMTTTENDGQRRILETYVNVLAKAREAEYLARAVTAVKRMVKSGTLRRYYSSILSSMKSKYARLDHEARSLELSLQDYYGQEALDSFVPVAQAFAKASESHRIWHIDGQGEGSAAHQVFFDLGIFDYIQSPTLTPLMRDSHGNKYFIYPEHIIVARSTTDFDILSLKDLSFIFRELPYDTVLDMMAPNEYADYVQRHRHHHHHHPRVSDEKGNLLIPSGDHHDDGDSSKVRYRVVGELFIPQLNLRFCSQGIKEMNTFVNVMNEYKEGRDL